MKYAIIILVVLIFIFMPLQTWSNLPKSATDSETIEQAIDRLVQLHESDPQSHLGANESLQAHKNADIIDHPAQSLVPDKFSAKQSFLYLQVNPFDAGQCDNCSIMLDNWFVKNYQTVAQSGDGYYLIYSTIPADMGWNSGDAIFDFIVASSGTSGTWQTEFDFTFGKVQFKQGNFRVGYYASGWQYSAWIPFITTKPIRFRFEYDSLNHKLNIYVRGILTFTYDFTLTLPYGEFILSMVLNRGTSSYNSIFYNNFQVWFDGI